MVKILWTKKIKIEKFKDQGFDDWQLREIWLGLNEGLNVLLYADVKYNWKTMKSIRLKLKEKRM